MTNLVQEVKVTLADEVAKAFQKMSDDLIAAKEALSEERIRAIVREELASWEKQQLQSVRVVRRGVETK